MVKIRHRLCGISRRGRTSWWGGGTGVDLICPGNCSSGSGEREGVMMRGSRGVSIYFYHPLRVPIVNRPATLTCHPANDHPVNPSPNLLWSTRCRCRRYIAWPIQSTRYTCGEYTGRIPWRYGTDSRTKNPGQQCILVYDCVCACVCVYMDIILTTTPISVSSESVHTQYDLWWRRRRKQTIQRGQS